LVLFRRNLKKVGPSCKKDYKTVEIMQVGKKRLNWFPLIQEALYSNSIA
jgi:hypothetical protein